MRKQTLRTDWRYRRGDIYMADLRSPQGSVQSGVRPVVVLQNNDGNYHCPTLIVAPLTTQLKKLNQPTHMVIRHRCLAAPSMIMLEQIITIDKSQVKSYLGHLSKQTMLKVDDYLTVSLDIHIPETLEAP